MAEKDQLPFLKENIQLGCVSEDCPQKKSILREVEKLGSDHRSQVLQGHDASRKKFGKERVHRRVSCKNVYLRANSVGSKLRGRNARRNPKTGSMRPQRHMGPVLYLKKEAQETFYSCRSLGNAGTLFEKARRARIRDRLQSINAHAEHKKIQSQVNWKLFEDPGTL